MRKLLALFILFMLQPGFAATANVTLSIPVINQSHYHVNDFMASQLISFRVSTNPIGGSPESLLLNIDPLNAPTNGQLLITRPRGSSFQFVLNYFSSTVQSDFCTFQLSPLNATQDDVSLIQSKNDAPVTCSYKIDAATQQPTIYIQDNAAHA